MWEESNSQMLQNTNQKADCANVIAYIPDKSVDPRSPQHFQSCNKALRWAIFTPISPALGRAGMNRWFEDTRQISSKEKCLHAGKSLRRGQNGNRQSDSTH